MCRATAVGLRVFVVVCASVAVGTLATSSGSGVYSDVQYGYFYQSSSRYGCVFSQSDAACSAILGLASFLLAVNILLVLVESWVAWHQWKKGTVIFDLLAMFTWLGLFITALIMVDYNGSHNKHSVRAGIAFSFLAAIPGHLLHWIFIGCLGCRESDGDGDDDEDDCPCSCGWIKPVRDMLIEYPVYVFTSLTAILSAVSLGLAASAGDASSPGTSCVLGLGDGSQTSCTLSIATSSCNLIVALMLFVEGLVRYNQLTRHEKYLPLAVDAVRLVLAGGFAMLQAVTVAVESMEWHKVPSVEIQSMDGKQRYSAHTIIACSAVCCVLWCAAFVAWIRQAYQVGQDKTLKANSPLANDTFLCGELSSSNTGVFLLNVFTVLASIAVIVVYSVGANENKRGGELDTTQSCNLAAGSAHCVYVYFAATISLLFSAFNLTTNCVDCFKMPSCMRNGRGRSLCLRSAEGFLAILWAVSWSLQIQSEASAGKFSTSVIVGIAVSILASLALVISICLRCCKRMTLDKINGAVSNWHFVLLLAGAALSMMLIGVTAALGYAAETAYYPAAGKCILGGDAFSCAMTLIAGGWSLASATPLAVYILARRNRAAHPLIAATFASLACLLCLGVAVLINVKWWTYSQRSILDSKANQVGNIICISSIALCLLWGMLSTMWWRDSSFVNPRNPRTGSEKSKNQGNLDGSINIGTARNIRYQSDTGTTSTPGFVNEAYRQDMPPGHGETSFDGQVLELGSPVGEFSDDVNNPLGHTMSQVDIYSCSRHGSTTRQVGPLRQASVISNASVAASQGFSALDGNGQHLQLSQSFSTARQDFSIPSHLQRLTPGGSWENGGLALGDFAGCPVMQSCWKYAVENLNLAGLPRNLFDCRYSQCFCPDHDPRKGDVRKWRRGEEPYVPPKGWCRFGIDPRVLIETYGGDDSNVNRMFNFKNDISEGWPVAFHGTCSKNIRSIFGEGKLVASGGICRSGKLVDTHKLHINSSDNPASIHVEFDHRRVFTSPSIIYCRAYARAPHILQGKSHMVALQMRINPAVRQKGPSTLDMHNISPEVPDEEIEWTVKDGKDAIIYGLLVHAAQ